MEPPDHHDDDGAPGGPDPGEPFDDEAFASPLPPDDRLWRHPSEISPFTRAGRARRGDQEAPPTPTPAPQPLLAKGRGVVWATATVAGVLGAAVAVGVVSAAGLLPTEVTVRETVVRETVAPAFAPSSRSGNDVVVNIAREAGPAVVRIDVRGDQDGSGSGVVFRDDGHVLTNAHVVDDADRIVVVTSDGSAYDAEVVGIDTVTDVAVVKLDAPAPMPTALIGTATGLRVGQQTIAIGSPLGLIGGSSVTTGVVSALGREVASREGPPLLDMIQTDAAIAPGSSGGALLDLQGTVIGITTAIAVSQVGAEGLGFAVPIDLAMKVGTEIIEDGRAVHVFLGVEGTDLDAAKAADAGLQGGAEIIDVVRGGPAADAGLVDDDVIVAIDGEQVRSMTGLVVALRARDPGTVVTLTVIRDGEVLDLTATLDARSR